tara:strand:- start:474 stop:719 length:246 start_codon:yes stop_codon:yes gene_type:complete
VLGVQVILILVAMVRILYFLVLHLTAVVVEVITLGSLTQVQVIRLGVVTADQVAAVLVLGVLVLRAAKVALRLLDRDMLAV